MKKHADNEAFYSNIAWLFPISHLQAGILRHDPENNKELQFVIPAQTQTLETARNRRPIQRYIYEAAYPLPATRKIEVTFTPSHIIFNHLPLEVTQAKDAIQKLLLAMLPSKKVDIDAIFANVNFPLYLSSNHGVSSTSHQPPANEVIVIDDDDESTNTLSFVFPINNNPAEQLPSNAFLTLTIEETPPTISTIHSSSILLGDDFPPTNTYLKEIAQSQNVPQYVFRIDDQQNPSPVAKKPWFSFYKPLDQRFATSSVPSIFNNKPR